LQGSYFLSIHQGGQRALKEAAKQPGFNIWMWCCTFRASFRNSREYSTAPSASLVADQHFTYVARGQLARSPWTARITKDSRGGRIAFADVITQPPSLLEADAGLRLFRRKYFLPCCWCLPPPQDTGT